ncbi:MAG TPA: hypothetical protein VMV50_00095 [Candidatus Paceibacterota bacterium]|nr:hypothetical protein [Candidatus Paceibacterota bacterium]
MTIAETRAKCKSAVERIPRDVRILAILVLVALLSFGLGYLAGSAAGQGEGVSVGVSLAVATSSDGQVVASRSGTKYYLPWCATAARISDANKVWFASESDAQTHGYAPATNCAGL